jgi:hypothetical protein
MGSISLGFEGYGRHQRCITSDELYTHLRCFEKKVKQASEYHTEPKQIAFPTQSNVKHFNSSTSRDNFIKTLDHEVSKDVMLLSKIFYNMLTFERKFNKKMEEWDKKVICFGCHKEGHTIQLCFLFFLISRAMMTTLAKRRDKNLKDGYKGKRKVKAMNVIWDVHSDDDNNDSDNKASQSQEINFALMVMVENILSGMDVETIIATKNITDPITIEHLRKIIKI